MLLLPLLVLAQASTTTIRELPAEGLRSYIRASDYPAEALAKREEGSVEFQVLVGIDGKVKSCTVARSSGSVALDTRTCEIMQERLRFQPAQDDQGRPVEDTYSSAVAWRLN